MGGQEKKEGMALTLEEAVETLSTIADLQFDHAAGSHEQDDAILQDKLLANRNVHWHHQKSSEATLNVVKESFRVILKHLQSFYKNTQARALDFHAIEEIKTIMVVVGEAAKKLDRYTTLFYKVRDHSVTNLKEYKQLQEFYQSRVARKIDEGTIGKWILALAQKGAYTEYNKSLQLKGFRDNYTKYIFMDLESVKKDTEYELFFLKKEDGTRFFSPRLIRNIKLVSDFGSTLEEPGNEASLYRYEEWQDKNACHFAKQIIRSAKKHIEKFYKEAMPFKDWELVELVNKSLIALMMAANPYRSNGNSELKSCRRYFYDFQLFLRDCLRSAPYQKLIAYPVDRSNTLVSSILSLIRHICMVLYTQLAVSQESLNTVRLLIQKASEQLSISHQEPSRSSYKLWSRLAGDYAALTKLLKGHPGGPLNRILSILEDGECRQFDPILQENLPSHLYTLYVQEGKYQFARWPSPTCQEFIHQAKVNEEFKAFLHSCAHEWKLGKVLLFNFQDRLSWKEHSRSLAIEDIPNHESFTRHIEVVTLEKDTEFYHQLAPYNQNNDAEAFMRNFKAQIANGNSGFFISKSLKKELMENFIPGALNAVHRIFFSQKNVLLREDRMNFIEIFYLFLQLKILECIKPDQVGFSCKDGLDISSAAGVELFAFLKLLNQERLSENDQEHLESMLYAPFLLLRERVMITDRFNRMLNALKTVEFVKGQFGQPGFAKIIEEVFGQFYRTPILKGKMILQN